METNQTEIIFAERAANYGRLSSILRDWGYVELEIQRLLSEQGVDQQSLERGKMTARSVKIPPGISKPAYSAQKPEH
jgi:hypothetical protein